MKGTVALTGLVLLAPPVDMAQTAAAPAFEVASVKLHEFPRGFFPFGEWYPRPLQINGNRVTTQNSIKGLVAAAYNVRNFQIVNAPDWTDSARRLQLFDVNAKTEGEGTPALDQVRLMLQGLLADRFQLKFHRETKSLPVYNLVVGKNGPKLQESGAEASPPRPPSAVAALGRIQVSNKSMEDLAVMLASSVDRPVLDKTGLTGHYDFTLEFTRGNPDLPADADDRSVFAAIQQQLGLKLVPANEPATILVIEHVEKPSAN
jgi:uncharacterized protein (TIGR03435 family)